MTSAPSLVLVATAGPITTITLHRPAERNALNLALLEQLATALAAAEADPTQRILILRGAGRVFCSGLDLAASAEPGFAERCPALLAQLLRPLAASRLITLAAVQGAAIAGGAGLMSACDFVVATRDAKFGYPELRRGLVPAILMTFVRRQLRERDARELLFLGKLITAEHALAIGLINRVAADEAALEVELQSLTASLLQAAPDALAATKQLLLSLWPSPLAADFAAAQPHHLAASSSPEAAEGIASFLEKRPPSWAPR